MIKYPHCFPYLILWEFVRPTFFSSSSLGVVYLTKSAVSELSSVAPRMIKFYLTIAALCFLALYRLVSYLRFRRAQRVHGCAAIRSYRHWDPFFGIDIPITTVIDVAKNRNLLRLTERFKQSGPNYVTTSLGASTIMSEDPELIQCVWVTKEKDWGYAPFRYEPMKPFCGIGFITTDGELWKSPELS